MKSLGKQTVFNESYCDGALIKAWTENRVVYESKGDYYINDLGNKKKIAVDADGKYQVRYLSKTIHSPEIEEIFERMGFKFKK